MKERVKREWKQILSLILSLCMVVGMVPMTTFAAEYYDFIVDNMRYKVLTEDTVALIGYEGDKPSDKLTVAESVYNTTGGGITFTFTVTEIGEEAFYDCGDITEVELPASLKSIGKRAFESTGITSVSIPASVEGIGEEAFAQCRSLTGFTVEDDNTSYSADNGVLYNKDKSTLVQYPPGKSFTGFTFPASVNTISPYAFAYMNRENEEGEAITESLTIGDSVEKIEDYAFDNCDLLGEIAIGSGVKSIGNNAFSQCNNLEIVTFAEDSRLKTIGKNAFDDCAFTKFLIPDSVESIGKDAFSYCKNLKAISIGKNIKDLGSIPFYANEGLESIDVDWENVKYSSRDGVLYNKSGETLLRYPAKKSVTEFTIPDGVTTLGEGSFYANDKLEKLVIPSTVNAIEDSVFYWASKLKEIRFLGDAPTSIGTGSTFHGTENLVDIYVPKGKVDAYKTALEPALEYTEKTTDIIKEFTIPGAIEVTSSGAIKLALQSTTPSAIWVRTDMYLEGEDTIEVGANHRLIIEEGKILSTGGNTILIPSGIKLTLEGNLMISVGGSIKVSSGATLDAAGGLGMEIGIIEGINSTSKIILEEGAKLKGLPGTFYDRGHNFISGDCTVASEDEIPSQLGLTAGEYSWDTHYNSIGFSKTGEIDWDMGYGLVVGGVRVDETNASDITGPMIEGGNISYNKDTKTLTFDNAKILISDNILFDYGIYSKDDLNINLIGTSEIGYGHESHSQYNIEYGIYAPGKDITISGDGDLTIYDYMMGVYAKNITLNSTGNIIISESGGGLACCLKAEGGSLTINSGNISLISKFSNGLYGNKIYISGGTIEAYTMSDDDNIHAFNVLPTFSSNYMYTITAGTSPSDAKLTANPTFREKYIKIKQKDPASGGTSGGGTGGGGGGGGPTTTSTPGGQESVKLDYTNSNGKVSLSMTTGKINEIISNAKNKEVILDLQSVKGLEVVNIPNNGLKAFEKAGLDLMVKLPEANATIDSRALESILSQSTGNSDMKLELNRLSEDKLSAAQKESIKSGDIVLDINIYMGDKNITEFDGKLTIDLPYKGDLPVCVWYLNDRGLMEKIESRYKDGQVSFTLSHLSLYVIGKDWVNPFTDVKGDKWYYDSVRYVYENGLMKGTETDKFNPNGKTTRGMIVTILHRLEGEPLVGDSIFTDVNMDKYYANPISWASENKIVNGYGNNKFGPEDSITREQLAVILMNYGKFKGYDLSAKGDLSNFEDKGQISNWAMEAMERANGQGLIQGKGENRLDPKGQATRAEIATILYRFLTR